MFLWHYIIENPWITNWWLLPLEPAPLSLLSDIWHFFAGSPPLKPICCKGYHQEKETKWCLKINDKIYWEEDWLIENWSSSPQCIKAIKGYPLQIQWMPYIGMMFCIFNSFLANALPVLDFTLLVLRCLTGKQSVSYFWGNFLLLMVCLQANKIEIQWIWLTAYSTMQVFLDQSLKMIEDRLWEGKSIYCQVLNGQNGLDWVWLDWD